LAAQLLSIFVILFGFAAMFSLYSGPMIYYNAGKELRFGRWLPAAAVPILGGNKFAQKRGEIFFLQHAACWITSIALVIRFEVYEWWGTHGYLIYGTACALPALIIPYLFPAHFAPKIYTYQSENYALKAVLWMSIYSYIGNYVFTHYFYSILGAKYTFRPAFRLNGVPVSMYLMTLPYFLFYHTLSNLVIRRVRTTFNAGCSRVLLEFTVVLIFAYFTAWMETFSISVFPYYTFTDRKMMYTFGSAFYALYFLVSFPMFYRITEQTSITTVISESLATCMVVLLLLDSVRLALGMPLTIS